MVLKFLRISKAFGQMTALLWRAQPVGIASLVFLETLESLISLASAWVTKLLFDLLALGLQGQPFSWREAAVLLLLQAGLSVFIQALGPVSSYLNSELNRRLALQVQMTIFRKVNSLAGLAPFENPKIRDTLQISTQGGQMGPSQIMSILTGLLRSAITLIGFLGVLITFNPLLASLVSLAALPHIFVQVRLGRKRFRIAEANTPKQRQAGYYSSLLTSTYIVKELRLFDLGNFFLNRFRQLTDELNRVNSTQQRGELGWQFGLNMLATLVYSSAFVVVVLEALQNRLSLGDVTLYTSAVSRVQGAIAGIVYSLANIHESSLFFSRYTELLALPQPIYVASVPCSVPPLKSAIELRLVSFRYSPEHPWVLRDFNLTIPVGKCVALIGLNGAGKTTLVKLLARLYDPCQGEILWDGVDVRRFDPVDLRKRIGAIFQDFVRYDLTAMENILVGDLKKYIGNGQAEATARQAAVKAGIHATLQGLPKGYQTTLSRWLVEEGQGVDLSGGEWQKIALARLFVREVDLFVLDEPTAALDAQAEQEVYNRFVELVNGHTSLLISHRFSTVRMANVIAVLEDGCITEYGSHEGLLERGGTYARLYKMQADRYR